MAEAAQVMSGGDGGQGQQQQQPQTQVQQDAKADWLGDLSNDNEFVSWLGTKGWNKPAAEVTPALAKSYRELEKFKGNGLQVPKDDAPAEQWGEFFTKLGRPEKADAYKIEGLPEGFDNDFVTAARGWAHEAGLMPRQLQAIVGKYATYAAERSARAEAEAEEKVEKDFETWKQELGTKADAAIASVQRGAKFAGVTQEEMTQFLRVFGPKRAGEILGKIGGGLEEHRMIDGKQVQSYGSPEAAAARMQEMQKDLAFLTRLNSGDAVAKREWNAVLAAMS